jgi:hypothetical protein
MVLAMSSVITPVEVLPPLPDADYQARFSVNGQVKVLNVFAGSYYEVWLVIKRNYPTASVQTILLLAF